jgi:hypothetical protein
MKTTTIMATLPTKGIENIQPGEIYERRLFTREDVSAQARIWKLREGKILDKGKHENIQVLQFVTRKAAPPASDQRRRRAAGNRTGRGATRIHTRNQH